MSENVPGGFVEVAHQQNNDASKLGRKQAPPDLFLPKGNTHLCILFAPYNMGIHVTMSNQLQKCCGSLGALGRPGIIFSQNVSEMFTSMRHSVNYTLLHC